MKCLMLYMRDCLVNIYLLISTEIISTEMALKENFEI